MNKTDELKKQVAELQREIERLEKEAASTPGDFMPDEFVQVGNAVDGEIKWVLEPFRLNNNGNSSPGKYRTKIGPLWDYCRRPVNVPGILIPWFGGDCPVGDRNAKVLVLFMDGSTAYREARIYRWTRIDVDTDIIAYMIIPEWVESLK